MHLRILIVVLLFTMTIITACGDSNKPQTQAQIDSNMIYLCKESVRKMMKDPESVDFRNVFVGKVPGGGAVCGEVNSKNSFGGYTGFQRFVSAGSISFIEENVKADQMDTLWQKFCEN